MSEFGFDEGSLFDTMSKPKWVETKFWYDDDGNVIKKREKIVSYWDAVMAVGGPTLIFLIVNLIKIIATRGPDWYTDEEQNFIKKYPWAYLALGPVGFKIAYKKAELAGTLYEELAGEKGDMITTSPERWLAQMKDNWGIAKQTTFDTAGGGVPLDKWDDCHKYHGIYGPLTAAQYEECRQRGITNGQQTTTDTQQYSKPVEKELKICGRIEQAYANGEISYENYLYAKQIAGCK